jgi:hypothetical protein
MRVSLIARQSPGLRRRSVLKILRFTIRHLLLGARQKRTKHQHKQNNGFLSESYVRTGRPGGSSI